MYFQFNGLMTMAAPFFINNIINHEQHNIATLLYFVNHASCNDSW